MFHTFSFLQESLEQNISEIEGVTSVNKLIGRALTINLKGQHTTIYAIGYNTTTSVGGPWVIVEGSSKPEKREIIVDKVFAIKNNIAIGTSLNISGYEFNVVGISDETNMMIYQYAFIPLEDAAEALNSQGYANFFVVSVEDGSKHVRQTIEDEIDGIDVVPKETFMNDNRKLIADSFLPILAVLVAIGFLTGVAVIGLTIYTATIEKTRDYGILKAIGANNFHIYKIIFKQSLIIALLGFAVGVLLFMVSVFLAGEFVPEFSIVITSEVIIGVFLSACAMSLIAAYLPIRRIARIDPLIVFKS